MTYDIETLYTFVCMCVIYFIFKNWTCIDLSTYLKVVNYFISNSNRNKQGNLMVLIEWIEKTFMNLYLIICRCQMLNNRLMKKKQIFVKCACKYKFNSIALFTLLFLSLLNKGTIVEHRNSYTVIEHLCHKCIIYVEILRQ